MHAQQHLTAYNIDAVHFNKFFWAIFNMQFGGGRNMSNLFQLFISQRINIAPQCCDHCSHAVHLERLNLKAAFYRHL